MTVHERLMMICVNGPDVNYNHWAVRNWLNSQSETIQDAVVLAEVLPYNDYPSANAVAKALIPILPKTTPDGVPITYTSVRAALRGTAFSRGESMN